VIKKNFKKGLYIKVKRHCLKEYFSREDSNPNLTDQKKKSGKTRK